VSCQQNSKVELGPKRPNILFIITDDQAAFTLSAYGNQVCQTPNINKLASDGMTFTSACHMGSWMSAVCVPSRIQIMTGKHVWNTLGIGISRTLENVGAKELALVERNRQSESTSSSMPEVFNKEDFLTFRTCKKGTSYAKANERFMYNYEKWCVEAEDTNGSQWHGDRALDFLEMKDTTRDERPFLMYLGFSHPHDPRHEKVEFYEKYGAFDEPPSIPNAAAPPLPVNYLPQHPFRHGNDNGRDEQRVQGIMSRRDEATIRNEIGRNYACIENIDVQIGRVLGKLEEMGELDNTYIFFTSDHGIAVGRHGLTGKQNLYEHSWKIPMIVRGPGIEKNSQAQGNIYLMDVLPTMCEIIGVDIPESCDGLSFLPVLRGAKETIRDVLYGAFTIFSENLGGEGNGSRPGIRAVKSGKWKLIKYDVYNGAVQETQLFDLESNPNELLVEHQMKDVADKIGQSPESYQIDLAEDPQYSAKLLEMEQMLLQEQRKYGDPYRLWNQVEK